MSTSAPLTHQEHIELSVLSHLLREASLSKEIIPLCSKEMFTVHANQAIFRFIQSRYENGLGYGGIDIARDLDQVDKLDEVGTGKYILQVVDYETGLPELVGPSFVDLKDSWTKRALANLFKGDTENVPVDKLWEQVDNIRHASMASRSIQEGKISDYVKPTKPKGIPTTMTLINDSLEIKGWAKGQVNVVYARSGDGKSMFMLQEALSIAALGHPVLYISVADLNKSDLEDRARRMYTGWTHEPNTHKEQWHEAVKALQKLPLVIRDASSDRHGRSVEDVCAAASRFCRKYKKHEPVVIIDYMQELTTTTIKSHNSYERDREINQRIIDLSREVNEVVIVGSQVTISEGFVKAKGGDFLNDRAGVGILLTKFHTPQEKKTLPSEYANVTGITAVTIKKSRFGGSWKSTFAAPDNYLQLKEL